MYIFEMPTLQKVLENSGGNENLLEELFYKFQLWLKQQTHLPQDITDQRLKYIIYAGKFDFEKAKKNLDKIYTLRSLVPEIYGNLDPLSRDINQLHSYVQWVTLPKLTPDQNRITFGRLINNDVSIYNTWIIIRYIVMTLEARMEEDIVSNNILLWDCTNFSFQHVLKYTPTILKVIDTCLEAYCARVKAIYMFNAPPFMDTFIKMMKSTMSAKLFERIHTYASGVESLYEIMPKSILPMDYGGEQPSVDTLTDMWRAHLVERRNWFLTEENRKSDESLRRDSVIDPNDLFGVSGTFRKLEID